MHRFTLAAGLALMCVPADAAPKSKPRSISVRYGGVCPIELHSVRPDQDGSSLSSIPGDLVSNSASTLNSVSLQFSLISGRITSEGTRRFSQAIRFDPVFSPDNHKERKDWEAIHGKRSQ